jgi:hypothetical protein
MIRAFQSRHMNVRVDDDTFDHQDMRGCHRVPLF